MKLARMASCAQAGVKIVTKRPQGIVKTRAQALLLIEINSVLEGDAQSPEGARDFASPAFLALIRTRNLE
jgi:hypothetical protein